MTNPNQKNNNQLVALLIIFVLVVGVLASLLWCNKETCGDGVCDPAESPATCRMDCRCGDGICSDGERCPRDCSADAPGGAPDAVSRAADTGGRPPRPVPPPVTGPASCRDSRFRQVLTKVVSECQEADKCVGGKSPLVSLSEEDFKSLFGRSADAGFASYFVVFGCNIYGTDCLGYDAYRTDSRAPTDPLAEPHKCPDNPRDYEYVKNHGTMGQDPVAQCRKYASVIHEGLRRFVNAHKEARYFVLIGTASRAGNPSPTKMGDRNIALAKMRAGNVKELLNGWRSEMGLTSKVPVVVLNNTQHKFDDPQFKDMVQAQLDVESASADVRGFTATQDHAINRSVLVLAVNCDLEIPE